MTNDYPDRLQLLTDAEVEALYALPVFNAQEREGYFYLEDADKKLLRQIGNPKSQLYFMLQLGYFRAKQQFFQFTFDDAVDDCHYLQAKYFASQSLSATGSIAKAIRLKQQQLILSRYGYIRWSNACRNQTLTHLQYLVSLHPKGHDTLSALLAYFESQQIIRPSYRICQDLIAEAFSQERERLTSLSKTIPEEYQQTLDAMINEGEDESLLNALRYDQKDFRYCAIKSEIEKVIAITSLYQFAQTYLPTLKLADNTILYYAQLAEHYSAARTRKLKPYLQYLYVLCFIHHRYQTMMDNLIMSFMLHIKKLMEEATAYAKQKEAEHFSSVMLEFPKLAELLQWFCGDSIQPDMPYAKFCEAAFAILPKDKQLKLADYIAGLSFDVEAAKWEYYEKAARRIALYLRPIILHVTFGHTDNENILLPLIAALKEYYDAGKPLANLMKAIPESLLRGLTVRDKRLITSSSDNSQHHPARFEMFVYRKLFYALDNGTAYCNDSVSYADLDTDLIDDALVDKADEISTKLGYGKLSDYCDGRLSTVIQTLESAWETTNQNIADESNEYFSIKEKDEQVTWSLKYPKNDDNNTTFFEALEQSDVIDLLKIVGDLLNIWSRFKPLKDRYTKNKQPEPMLLLGCILAEALGFGSGVMSKMSNVSLNKLKTIDENFLYVDNLRKVNDVVSNYIHQQTISRTWDLFDSRIIADADGQKFETRHHTLQSRYSAKYFGQYKGISVSTLVANHIPINSKVIGPNEHESHHLYDIIYNNSSDVIVDSVTGDGHSKNQCNYIALDSINIAFIPSLGDIVSEAEKLVGTKSLSSYTGFLKPSEQADLVGIKSEKRGIIRILLSLMLQKTTQAVIIRKLSSHKRYSKLKEAFWAYNKLFHSCHTLNFIDDAKLRQAIRTARNRTEAYHQLHRTIRKVYGGIFKGRRIVDNAISAQASRLVTNLIIAYNTMLLEKIYRRLIKRIGEEKARAIMEKISPVAWQHILFTGRYDLIHQRGMIDIEQLVELLEGQLQET